MPAKILDGTRIAASIRDQLKTQVEKRQQNKASIPGLAMVLVGNDPASAIYVRNKTKACAQVGFKSVNQRFDNTVSQQELLRVIDGLNEDSSIHGILVQLPLPKHLDTAAIVERILPDKDVDGFHPYNIGRLAIRMPGLRPATPKGVMRLIEHTGTPIRGCSATVVGASNHVGRPLGLELLLAGCTTTTVHKFTQNVPYYTKNADILISAVGKPSFIQGNWIKLGAIVIDVGLTRQKDGSVKGDIDFVTAQERAGWLTPVPGGVGPMTITALLENTLQAARNLDDPKTS